MTKSRIKKIVVVETYDGRAFVGYVERLDGSIKVMTGMAGRPPVLLLEDVMAVTPASKHRDVVSC